MFEDHKQVVFRVVYPNKKDVTSYSNDEPHGKLIVNIDNTSEFSESFIPGKEYSFFSYNTSITNFE